MTMLHSMCAPERIVFQNKTERGLGLEDVRERVLQFVAEAPASNYHFIIGTDSQVHRGYTKFATGVVIHRLGQGAWACYRQFAVPRELTKIREKLMLETIFSQQIAHRFDPDELRSCLKPQTLNAKSGASLLAFIDIDAGTVMHVNKTAQYVQEMADCVLSTGQYAPRVKPYAYAASSYANRYTKRPFSTIS
ncbi:ribonuclease H-like YkuK family protein [Cohnella yongneupensis]|uniref:Ribonuclease H-like YkuK family protein n=1 Tax=Cohnella yongneupensis TaxID=425006 RepID=A0ABW0R1E0_9BACL